MRAKWVGKCYPMIKLTYTASGRTEIVGLIHRERAHIAKPANHLTSL